MSDLNENQSIRLSRRSRQHAHADQQRKYKRAWLARIGIFFFSALLALAILVLERRQGVGEAEFQIGDPAPRTLFSPFEISFDNDKATEALQLKESLSVPGIYTLDPTASEAVSKQVEEFFDTFSAFLTPVTEGEVQPQPGKLSFEITETTIRYFQNEGQLAEARKHVEALTQKHLARGVLSYSQKRELLEDGSRVIAITNQETKREKVSAVEAIPTVLEARELALREMAEVITRNRKLRNAVIDIFDAVMISNLVFDEEETKKRRDAAQEAVEPIEDVIKKNELIVQRGILVTSQAMDQIKQIQKKIKEKKFLNEVSSIGLLVLLVYGMCFTYLYIFERKKLMSFQQIWLINTVMLLTISLSKLITLWQGPASYLMPTALAPLVLVLLSTARLGVLASVMVTILVAPLAQFQPDILLASLISGFAATFAALKIRKRLQFLIVGLSIGLGYFLVLFAFRIMHEYPLVESVQISAHGLANGMITTALCFLIVPLFEMAFDLVTDITLLELSDLNHPLLKKMMIEAPGTYHHSHVVANLAEAACETINANPLLARVGCYFHDIGKIARSEFFTENQNKRFNRHDKLTPTMSCLVILSHVKDGIELGRKYKLRGPILNFIPEHQGTGIIFYFYKKALDQAKQGEKVDPNEFRYPGPNPQSRETAVALLADSTEAASRSLKDPSPDSIRQLVRKIFNDKFTDGQLDECDLTLKDLHKIQESFIHNLMAINHTRVQYPGLATDHIQDKPDLFKQDSS